MIPSSEEYRVLVARTLAGLDEEHLVFNGTLDHARVVVEEAFRVATRRIRILSNVLTPTVYDSPSVLDAAEGFIGLPETKVDILVEEPDGRIGQSAFLRTLTRAGTRTRILQVPRELVKAYTFNFLTVDETGFRFEQDRTKPIAVVGGGKPSPINRHLNTVFDDLFSRSEEPALTLELA